MDLEVKMTSDLSSVTGWMHSKSKYLLDNDLTDLQKVFISLLTNILRLRITAQTESEWESKAVPLITQWISIFPSMDLDPQSLEHVRLELELLVSQKKSFNYLEFTPLIHQIYSIVFSSPESKSKWMKKSKNLIFLSPQLQLRFVKGKFSVAGNVGWNSNNSDNCFRKEMREGIYLYCYNCNGKYHEEIKKAPVEIKNHHLHPKHHLQLATIRSSRVCYCCDDDLLWVFYYCSACDFAINVSCLEKPPLLLAIEHPKWHEHPLALFSRHAPLTCNLCALDDLNSPVYMCPPCGFVAHLKCINNLPRLIRISRHPHRISFTHSFDQGDLVCSVCRRKIDNDYGGYSCFKDGCSYAAHSKCATRRNIWDGVELEGEPEEVEDEVVEPFVRISDGIIQHFSHQHHHLILHPGGGDYDDNKLCQACVTPIYFGNFYSCTQCDFILHEACANLSRKIYHPIHPHQLSLVGEDDGPLFPISPCSACREYPTGFFYKCDTKRCYFKLHVQCATISEPLVHESHIHPLFLTSKPGERRTCSVCRDKTQTFNCIECNFALCFACAILPQKVRYKHDKHILTLSYGEEMTSSLAYWCEVCEGGINPKERFYMCEEYCCITLHIECLLGRLLYMRPGSFFPFSKTIFDVVCNNGMTRPICQDCEKRCEGRVYFHSLGSSYCSPYCD